MTPISEWDWCLGGHNVDHRQMNAEGTYLAGYCIACGLRRLEDVEGRPRAYVALPQANPRGGRPSKWATHLAQRLLARVRRAR